MLGGGQAVGTRGDGGAQRAEIAVVVIGADHQFVRTAQPLERAGGVEIQRVLAGFRHAVGVGHAQSQPGTRIGERGTVGAGKQQAVGIGGAMVVGQPPAPAAGELLFQGGEDIGAFALPPVPACRGAVGARQPCRCAIAEEQRRGTPRTAIGMRGEVVDARAQPRAVGEVGFEHAVHAGRAVLLEAHPAVLFGVGAHHAAAHAPAGGQRAGHIEFGAAVVPGADIEAGTGLERRGGALAHHVDGGRWIARAGHQATGAAHHFDTLVDRGVAEYRIAACTGGVVGRHAIEHEVVDCKSARSEQRAVAVVGLHGDAWRLLQHLGDGDEVEVFDALAGEHRQRLRRLAQRQRQLGGGIGAAHLVALGAAGHQHLVQRVRCRRGGIVLCMRGGGTQRTGALQRQQQAGVGAHRAQQGNGH